MNLRPSSFLSQTICMIYLERSKFMNEKSSLVKGRNVSHLQNKYKRIYSQKVVINRLDSLPIIGFSSVFPARIRA
jgi:hypothetical protein